MLQEIGEKLLRLGAKIVIVKCGKKGYYIRTVDKEILKDMGRQNGFSPAKDNPYFGNRQY